MIELVSRVGSVKLYFLQSASFSSYEHTGASLCCRPIPFVGLVGNLEQYRHNLPPELLIITMISSQRSSRVPNVIRRSSTPLLRCKELACGQVLASLGGYEPRIMLSKPLLLVPYLQIRCYTRKWSGRTDERSQSWLRYSRVFHGFLKAAQSMIKMVRTYCVRSFYGTCKNIASMTCWRTGLWSD